MQHKFGASVAAAARAGLLTLGVAASRQAWLDYQAGDYPGGGMVSLTFLSGKSRARADHCLR